MDCKVQTPHGKILSRQILEHTGCVVIIPKIGEDRFILVRQYRFPIGKHLWEFPAGGREKGESFAAAARRELMEEVGLKPGRLKKISQFYPTPGVSGEIMHLFIGSQLRPASAPKDEDEIFELREFTFHEIEGMIRTKKIVDAKTLIGFFYLKHLDNCKI